VNRDDKIYAPRNMWVLIDKSNSTGPCIGSKHYMWFFLTRSEARDHLKKQNADPEKARLCGPFKYQLIGG
jgi:hypothetical protein